MSNKERVLQLIEDMPDEKLVFVRMDQRQSSS